MDNLKIGVAPLELDSLLLAIRSSQLCAALPNNWQIFVKNLGFQDDKLLDLSNKLREGSIVESDITREIVSDWVQKLSDCATLKSLCKALFNSPSDRLEFLSNEVYNTEIASLQSAQNLNHIPLEIEDIIGIGNCSEVFRGSFSGRTVAVKRVTVHASKCEIEAGEDILKLLKCSNHDNTVIHYCRSRNFSDGQIKFLLAMDFCESTLEELIESNQQSLEKLRISDPSRIVLLTQATEGIYHLHQMNIFHRDLKPANILLKTRGETVVVKLADFGISKVIQGESTSIFTNQYDWIAPEIKSDIKAGKDSSSTEMDFLLRANIFSLGCIFYYVLSSGQHPFPDGNPFSNSEFKPILDLSKFGSQYLYYNMVRLILFMISADNDKRPRIEDVKNHPSFWSAEKRLSFITDSFDSGSIAQRSEVQTWVRNAVLPRDATTHQPEDHKKCAAARYSNFETIFVSNKECDIGWLNYITKDVIQELPDPDKRKGKKPNPYKGKNFCHLWKAIRHFRAHMTDKSVEVQNLVGHTPEEYLSYWQATDRFPFLLDFIWTGFQSIEEYKNACKRLDTYYNGIDFNFSQKLDNEVQFVIDSRLPPRIGLAPFC